MAAWKPRYAYPVMTERQQDGPTPALARLWRVPEPIEDLVQAGAMGVMLVVGHALRLRDRARR
jgi:hypothetical protein